MLAPRKRPKLGITEVVWSIRGIHERGRQERETFRKLYAQVMVMRAVKKLDVNSYNAKYSSLWKS